MTTVPFDTLRLAQRLAAGGFTEEQARTFTSALSEAFAQDIATKADIDRLDAKIDTLNTRLDAKIDALDARLTQKIDALDAKFTQKFEALDTKFGQKLETLESRMTVKLGGMMVVAVGAIVSLVKLIPS
jgi:DNA primase large subunit